MWRVGDRNDSVVEQVRPVIKSTLHNCSHQGPQFFNNNQLHTVPFTNLQHYKCNNGSIVTLVFIQEIKRGQGQLLFNKLQLS